MDFLVKRCEYEELTEVAHLYNELSKELKQFANDKEKEEMSISDHTMARILRSAIKECELIIFVAKSDDKVIGFISGSIKKGDTLVSSGKPSGYIEGAYVLQDCNVEDVLSQLEDKLIKQFTDCKAVYKGLDATNESQSVKDKWMSHGYQSYKASIKKHVLL